MTLQALRKEIEDVDQDLLRLIKARMDIAVRIAAEKSVTGHPTRDPERAARVLAGVMREAETCGLDPEAVRDIFSTLIRMSEDLQDQQRK
jgi:chorismate mutase